MIVKDLGQTKYEDVLHLMQEFTSSRNDNTLDEVWLVEHFPVFTLGQAGLTSHILQKTDIPIVKSDRGGQITYHGPGQLVVYILFNLKKNNLNIRDLISIIENSIIELLNMYKIQAQNKKDAPGVYVADAKIASLGLRIKKGCSYHGLSLNVNNDLTPFTLINPCGYSGQKVTNLSTLGIHENMKQVSQKLLKILSGKLSPQIDNEEHLSVDTHR